MNLFNIGKLIISNYFFMRALTKHYGEPVKLSKEEREKVLNDLKADKMMEQKFAVVFNIKSYEADFHLNMDRYLPFKGEFKANKFFNLLHFDFIEDYLKYARATYTFVDKNKHLFSPLAQCARSTIPMKLKDGRYHWILQEAITFEFDADNNLLSHLNIYTILRPMEDGENVSIVSRLYNNGFEVTEWSQLIWKEFFTSRAFELTPEQSKIVNVLNSNLDYTNSEIANILYKQKNNIDIQNKQILARARDAFPNQKFDNIKDVTRFLDSIGYFANGNKIDE